MSKKHKRRSDLGRVSVWSAAGMVAVAAVLFWLVAR